jgi:hypothetical protein
MTARIYQKCLEVALNDQTINETIQNRERIEMPLVKIRKTLIGHWPTNKVMEGFHITRVRIILDYRSNENASYNESCGNW